MSIMGFMSGLETAIRSTALATATSARASQPIDMSGPYALSRLANALRAERRRNAALKAELIEAYRRLSELETGFTLLPPRRR
ncbi:hypothetical protein GCM10011390_02630 [Aureimonas endophytica]|uniref:Transposase n=1 Tax=Aureimonas endophytica TaxID=2027858 RepID=A0A917E0D3_9HYPH|nr:hypothetical protein [Aureimonas endophytica]GGD87390.1 hypothetical protein GCM10011390_02630 [Aureimonas endophytica]